MATVVKPNRREFISSAGLGVMLVGALASPAQAQLIPSDPEAEVDRFIETMLERYRLAAPSDLDELFSRLFRQRVVITLAEVEEPAQRLITEIVGNAVFNVSKEFPRDIPSENRTDLIVRTVHFQNSVFGAATDLGKGVIRVTESTTKRAIEAICPLFPFC